MIEVDRGSSANGDLLDGVSWECTSCASDPDGADPGFADAIGAWEAATVPGTAAQAMADAGHRDARLRDYDADDWWFRCRFEAPGDAGPHTLQLGGLATLADVWLNGIHVLHSENMFIAHEVPVARLLDRNELLIRFASLAPFLAQRRARPRWRCPDLVHQNLRWLRSSLIGRQTGGVRAPAPVGPWRPVTLSATRAASVRATRVETSCDPDAGTGNIRVELSLRGVAVGEPVLLEVAGESVEMENTPGDGDVVARGDITIPSVQLWWPHTHGPQTLYDVRVVVGDRRFDVARVGFRRVEIDRSDGGFTLRCNDVELFCRGACWTPPDPVSLNTSPERLRRMLESVRDANMNMLRVTGVGVYEAADFYDLCDELGILVWQDCMFAFYDVPDDADFAATVTEEVDQVLRSLQGRPCVAVLCGGSESEQQAEYLGLSPQDWVAPIADELIADLVAHLLPGTPYVRNSPSGSPLPSMVDRGPGHYFGVGAYLMPLEDARRSRVRFASECLAFANPAEPMDTPAGISAARGIGHRPEWKESIHRDANTSWDLEDVRDHYTNRIFDVDTIELRRLDANRAHLLARATVASIYESVLSEWRRPTSMCAGAIVLHSHDVSFGGGLGILDGLDRPKSSWYVMRRVMGPRVVLMSDEGVNGLVLHVLSDSPDAWMGSLTVSLYLDGEVVGDSATQDIEVSHGAAAVESATVFDGFRDLNHAHKFAPPAYDVVAATLRDTKGDLLSQAFLLPGEPLRPIETDLGLRAVATSDDNGGWTVEVSTERFAQWVSFDIVDWVPSDSWFHLAPDTPISLRLSRRGEHDRDPRGHVLACNARHPARLELER